MAALGFRNYWDGYFAGALPGSAGSGPRWSTRLLQLQPGRGHGRGLRDRGLLNAAGRFTDAGRAAKTRIE